MPTFRSAYSKSVRHGLDCPEPSLTKQAFKKECDINHLLNKYQKTGVMEHINTHNPRYEDFSDVPDYQTSLGIVMQAQESFSSLPSSIRKKFDNDPGLFLDFVSNPANEAEMRELGLITSPAPERLITSPAPEPVPADSPPVVAPEPTP